MGAAVSPTALGGDVEFQVEIALEQTDVGPDTALWAPDVNEGLWDTDTWSGLIPSWVNVTPRAINVATNRGRDRWETAFRMGASVAVLDNQDGIFSVDSQNQLGDLRLRPGRWLRVRGRVPSVSDTWYVLSTGQISTIADIYSVAAASINSRFDTFDFMARFQIDNPPALQNAIPAGQLTSERVTAVLDAAGWTQAWRDIQTGVHTMAASDLAQSRLAELQAASAAEGGAFFIDGDGFAVFKARDWLLTDDRSVNVQWSAGGFADDIQLMKADTNWSDQRIYNDVAMARVGGTVQRVTDGDSESLYGPRTFQRFDLQCQTDQQVLDLAQRFLEAFKWDRPRLEQIEVLPTTAEASRDLLATKLGDRIRVTVRTLQNPKNGAGWSYTSEYFVNRIRHNITADDWITTLRIDSADLSPPFDVGGFDPEAFDEGYFIGGDAP